MILVAGSTGILGSEIVRQLRVQDKPVRALVRKTSDPEKVAHLKALGATIIEGDLTDPASLDAVCEGIETLITTVTTTLSQTPGDIDPHGRSYRTAQPGGRRGQGEGVTLYLHLVL